jgi:hypothetical protein
VKALLIIALAGVVGYFVYQAVTGEAHTCASEHSYCIKSCRRTSTEAPAAQACQEACQREADACKARR